MRIARGTRRWAATGLVLVVLTGCAATVAGVAAAPGAGRSAAPPVPVSESSGNDVTTQSVPGTTEPGTAEPATTEPGTTEPATTEPGTTEPGTTALGSSTARTSATPTAGTSATGTPTSRVTTSTGPTTGPAIIATLGDSGAIEVGSASARIVVDVFEEPMCPPCATFSARYGAQLAAAALSGKAKVRFRIANFLDSRSHSKNYSTRAIAALLTVLAYDRDPRTLLAVQDAIFDDRNQPVEGAAQDLTDAQLAALAVQHGAGPESAAAIEKGLVRRSAVATARLTRSYMVRQKVTAVPWVQVDGRTVNINDPQWVQKALSG